MTLTQEKSPSTAAPLRLLHIEDDPEDRHAVRRYAKACDAPVIDLVQVASLQEGYEAVAQGDFDLILVDARLTQDSGLYAVDNGIHGAFELQRHTRAQIFILSGLPPEVLQRSAAIYENVAFLSKASLGPAFFPVLSNLVARQQSFWGFYKQISEAFPRPA